MCCAAVDRVDSAKIIPRLNQEKRGFDIEADSIKIFEERLANQIALGLDHRLRFGGGFYKVRAIDCFAANR